MDDNVVDVTQPASVETNYGTAGFDLTQREECLNVVEDNGMPFVTGAVATLTRIPGPKTFQESNCGDCQFNVELDGTVNFDSNRDGLLAGRGTSALLVNGFEITVDATPLNALTFNVVGDIGNPFPDQQHRST